MKKLLIVVCLFATGVKAADTGYMVKRLSPVPKAVNNIDGIVLNLGGSWYFNPAPENGFENSKEPNTAWSGIEVPGEWAMQGFTAEKNAWTGYMRSFTVPAAWEDNRIKLRCDAIYSESEIYINGKKAGSHLGGFTPFEFDITHLVKAGTAAVIAIKVKNDGIADSLASGSRYAVHPLGGITRNIQLIALPQVNIAMFHAATIFDSVYTDALLKAEVELANESTHDLKEAFLLFELIKPGSNEPVISKRIAVGQPVGAQGITRKIIELPVQGPVKWDPEHPNLYTFRLTLQANGTTEIIERRIGFRQVEVRQNKLYVNNMPVKARGVCRHEVSPLRGRSLNGDQWKEDVRIFAEGNVNFIRTSHYPPAEAFLDACDSLGMFVEVEAPFCWANETEVPDALYKTAILDQTMDMVNQLKSHPSILIWSLANESNGVYKKYFRKSGELVKAFDPTRPRIFEQYGEDEDDGELELSNQHYPGPEGPSRYAGNNRPISFGEYAHLNAYNRLELLTDPGIRDAWGIGLNNMWEKMYTGPSMLGGAIWAGIDDTFILPNGKVVGYGTWGPIDGWRRQKPEYWNMKKIYSPVKIKQAGNYNNDSVSVEIENRLLFSNLDECTIQWKAGKYSGNLETSLPAGQKKTVAIKITGSLTPADTLFVDVYDPRNILVDKYAFAIVAEVKENTAAAVKLPDIAYKQTTGTVTALIGAITVQLNKYTGSLAISKNGAGQRAINLSQLMILPLNGDGRGIQMTGEQQQDFPPFTQTCHNHFVKKVTYEPGIKKFVVNVYDTYEEATGYTRYEISGDKTVKATYRYTINKDVNPRQWGLVLTAPDDFNTLSWQRNGLWNYYPDNQIGRLSGTAKAISPAPVSGPAGPVQKPSVDWLLDRNELGTNDFRSTKMNIIHASIAGNNGVIKILSDGSQHVRTWKENKSTRILIAGYSNLGAERFFRGHAQRFDKPLKQDDIIEGSIILVIE